MTPISVSLVFLGMIAIPGTHPIVTKSIVTCDTDFSDLTYSISPVICPKDCWRQRPRNRLCGLEKYSGGSICLAALQLGLIDNLAGGVVTVYKNMNVSFKPVGGFRDGVTSHNCSRSKVSYTFEITCDTNGNAMYAVNKACCPPKCGGGLVLGSDPYHVNSSVCSAAVHAGKVSKEHGGDVTFYNFKDVLNISGLVGNGVVGASGSSVEIFTFKLLNECKRPIKACDNNATCSDNLCGFRCACTPGFKGKLCNRAFYCDSAPTVSNGGSVTPTLPASPGYHGNSLVTASCANGFVSTTGSETAECSSTNTWTPATLECIGITDCFAGVKDGRVADSQMTASSNHSSYPPSNGRLDGDSYWIPQSIDPGEWLQVDFLLANKTIYGVVTQGGRWESDGKAEGWATKFEIKYGNDTATLHYIMEGSTAKVFDGNVDWKNHKINWFPHPVTARYFRLVMVAYNGSRLRLRLEYLTC